MSKLKSGAAIAAGPVIACCVAFTPIWEGMDKVARADKIGTGHPITYCYGMTKEAGPVRAGQRFTKKECDALLGPALEKYWAEIEPCIHVPLPAKTAASLLDGAWNAGSTRVCRSPMLAQMNAGNIRAGCNAFAGWIIRSNGVVRPGLIDRRDGEDHGDPRLSEKGLCLEGLRDPANKTVDEPAAKPLPKPRPVTVAAPTCNSWIWKC